MTRIELKKKIWAHQYAYTHNSYEYMKDIENCLEDENHHRLLKLLIAHQYKEAIMLVESENY